MLLSFLVNGQVYFVIYLLLIFIISRHFNISLHVFPYLAKQGISCPLPVKTKGGEVLQELNERPAAVISFLPGLWPRRVHPFHCAELGHHLAAMHLACEGFELTRRGNVAFGCVHAYEGGRADNRHCSRFAVERN